MLNDPEYRFAFQHRTGIGERVEGANFNVMNKRLHINVADRAEVQSAIGLESVDQTTGFGVVGLAAQMLLDHDKRFCIHSFQLNPRLVMNLTVQQLQFVLTDAFDRMRNQNLRRRQRVMSTGADLRENRMLVLERNPVPVGRDVHIQQIVFAFVRTTIAKLE